MSHRRRLRFALSFSCLVMIVLHFTILRRTSAQIIAGRPDLCSFYTAGLMLRRGQAHSLYEDAAQWRTQREFVSSGPSENNLLPYNHPPFEAILFLPLTYLTFIHAYSTWFLVNILLIAISMYFIRSWIPAMAIEFPELLFLAPLAFYPAFVTCVEGQDSVLLLTLYCLAYAAFRRRRDLPAGILLGLGLFKFHLVLPFVLILLLLRRWRAISGIAISGCAEFAISWALVGWKELVSYPGYVWRVNRMQAVIVPVNMPNLRGLLTGGIQLPPMRAQLEVLAFVSICLLVWAARQWSSWDLRSSDRWNTGFSIAVITTFLVGYHGHTHDLSIALLPVLITFNRLLESSGSGIRYALRVILGLMFLSPLYLLLTLLYKEQCFFALILLAFIFCMAASCSTKSRSHIDSRRSASMASLA